MQRILKTAALVVVLTALIWTWAEHSQIATLQEHRVELAIRMPDSNWLVRLDQKGAAPSWAPTISVPVTATYTGPQSGISELERQVKQFEFTLPRPADDAREVTLDLTEVLRGQPVLAELHTGVTEVEPRSVTLAVARVQEYTLTVVPVYSDLAARQAECRPARATVRLPNAVYDGMPRKEIRAQVVVGPGADLTQPIAVELPDRLDGFKIDPNPRTVQVVTNILVVEQTIENVQVNYSLPPDFPLQDYRLDSEKHQWRKTLVVRGPSDRTLTVNDLKSAVALKFELTDIKPTAVPLSRDVEITLPRGFTLVSPLANDPDRLINFRWIRQSEERPPP